MAKRKCLVSTFWLTTALALLAVVLAAPIRTSGFAIVSSRPDCLRRTFALPQGQPTTRLSAGMGTDAVLDVNALAYENEERDRADALDEHRVSFPIPCSFGKVADRQSIAPRSIVSVYPLRC